jgi:hypothetical protein
MRHKTLKACVTAMAILVGSSVTAGLFVAALGFALIPHEFLLLRVLSIGVIILFFCFLFRLAWLGAEDFDDC